MTGKDVLGKPRTSHFGYIAHGRDDIIFYPHIICNHGCHGLHDDYDCTCKSVGMDSSAMPAA